MAGVHALPWWRLILVKSTLSAMVVHALLALDLPVKTLSAVEKIFRGFLWRGRKEVHGGHCIVAWDKVCCPKELGGPWLQRTIPDKLWQGFNIQVPAISTALFLAGSKTVLGDGATALFWTDKWLQDGRICDLAPNLFLPCISERRARDRSRMASQGVGGRTLTPTWGRRL